MNEIATIMYMPALHQGYINFLDKTKGEIILANSKLIIKDMPRLERDIRAVPANQMQKVLRVLYPDRKISIINQAVVDRIIKSKSNIIMPNEDVSHLIKKHYFKKMNITFVDTFLRWDRQISTTEKVISKDRTITQSEIHKELMGLALDEARKSVDWWRQVGAVISHQGRPVLIGHNKPVPSEHYLLNTFGDPRSNFDAGEFFEISKAMHAEASLIAEAARKGITLEGHDIYVTTFPCPVCAKLVAAAGIKRVYYSQGYSLLDAEDIFKTVGVEVILVQT